MKESEEEISEESYNGDFRCTLRNIRELQLVPDSRYFQNSEHKLFSGMLDIVLALLFYDFNVRVGFT